ncbi:zinc-ribbon domain-containing protein [Lachnospiraceae bacterium YH-ros2228]
MFCKKCGAELQPNMTFCPNCGTPVSQSDGETSKQEAEGRSNEAIPAQEELNQGHATNQAQEQANQDQQANQNQQAYQSQQVNQNQQAYQNQQATPAQPNQVSVYFKNLFNTWKIFMQNPADIGKKFVEYKDVKLACGFIVIQAILSALFGMLFEGQTLAKLAGFFGESDALKPVYGKIFFGTLAYSILFQLILAGCIFLVMMIVKNPLDFKQAIALVSLRSMTLVPVILFSFIVLLINPIAGCFVFFAGSIWGLILIAVDLPIADQGKNGLIYFLLFAAIFLTLAVKVFLMVKTGASFYLPASDIEDLKSLLSGDFF